MVWVMVVVMVNLLLHRPLFDVIGELSRRHPVSSLAAGLQFRASEFGLRESSRGECEWSGGSRYKGGYRTRGALV